MRGRHREVLRQGPDTRRSSPPSARPATRTWRRRWAAWWRSAATTSRASAGLSRRGTGASPAVSSGIGATSPPCATTSCRRPRIPFASNFGRARITARRDRREVDECSERRWSDRRRMPRTRSGELRPQAKVGHVGRRCARGRTRGNLDAVERAARVDRCREAGLDPDSISLELAGSRITVMAHDRAGKLVGSRVVRVRDAVDEEGATVVYERDGSLTIRLRKTPTFRGSFEDGNAARTFVSAATNRLGPDHTSLGGARTLPTASAA